MTSPQPPHTEPAEPTPAERRAIVALAALLAAGFSAAALTPRVRTLLGPLGVSPAAAAAAVRLATQSPPARVARTLRLKVATTPRNADRQPIAQVLSGEPGMRARYLLAASRRLTAAANNPQSLAVAVEAERRHYDAHTAAQARRMRAGARVEVATRDHGRVLGWYARRDPRTTPDCAALDRTNFTADRPPAAGWPGTRHGGTCRCTPGPAHATRVSTDEAYAAYLQQQDTPTEGAA